MSIGLALHDLYECGTSDLGTLAVGALVTGCGGVAMEGPGVVGRTLGRPDVTAWGAVVRGGTHGMARRASGEARARSCRARARRRESEGRSLVTAPKRFDAGREEVLAESTVRFAALR